VQSQQQRGERSAQGLGCRNSGKQDRFRRSRQNGRRDRLRFAVGRPEAALPAAFLLFSFVGNGCSFLAFATSPEYQSNVIRANYEIFLGRQPSPLEIAAWLARLQGGTGEKQTEAVFLASDEFFARHHSSNSAWVEGVYRDVLGRPADPGGLQAWTQNLLAGMSRNAVALAIVDSLEADARLVTGAYHDILKRNPDPAGLSAFVADLQHGLTPSELLAELAGSEEYITLTAHGMLDVQVQPIIVNVAPVVFVEDPFIFDPFFLDTFVFDSGGFDGGGCDCGGFDAGFDSGGFDGGFDGGGDGGDF